MRFISWRILAEAEGLQSTTTKIVAKALMLGVTVGGDGNRTHRIFMIRQRGILAILHSRGVPFIMSDTGGRVKPLPMRPDKLKNLGDVNRARSLLFIH